MTATVDDTKGRMNGIVNTAQGIRKYFGKLERCRVVIEAGTHSRWVSRIVEELGHEVLVGNPPSCA